MPSEWSIKSERGDSCAEKIILLHAILPVAFFVLFSAGSLESKKDGEHERERCINT